MLFLFGLNKFFFFIAGELDIWADFRYNSEINPNDPSASQRFYKRRRRGRLFEFISSPPEPPST